MIRLKFQSWIFRIPMLRSYDAMCVGRTIHFRDKKEKVSLELLAHELVHQHQMDVLGVRRFYWMYLKQWIRAGFSYRGIQFEQEAYEYWATQYDKAKEMMK
jgi:hypothetical protein